MTPYIEDFKRIDEFILIREPNQYIVRSDTINDKPAPVKTTKVSIDEFVAMITGN